MNRLRFLACIAALLVSLNVSAAQRPNVLFITVDDMNWDSVGVFGCKVPDITPNIDRLAKRGQVFTNAVASFHQTSMSMAALFTGRTPSIETGDRRVGLPWNGSNWCGLARFADHDDERCIPDAVPTLAE